MTPEAKKYFEKFAHHFHHQRLAKILQDRFDRIHNDKAKTKNPAEPNPNAQAAGQDNRTGVMANGKNNG